MDYPVLSERQKSAHWGDKVLDRLAGVWAAACCPITVVPCRDPADQAVRAHETLRDPYLFDFLGLGNEAHERDIENALVRHITQFLLELGRGLAFLGTNPGNAAWRGGRELGRGKQPVEAATPSCAAW